jgi:hypothetical protein
MTLDEQLRRALDPLADRLRDEISKQIDSATCELSALVREQTDAAIASARIESPSPGNASMERLLDAMRSLDGARSLSEILDTTVACVGREVERAGVWLVGNSTLRAWRFRGFDKGFDVASSIELPLEESGLLGEAVKANMAIAGHDAPSFARLAEGQTGLAVPVAMAGTVIAVVYADQGANRDADLPGALIEALVRHGARCLEALTAIKAARALTEQPHAGRGAPEAARTPDSAKAPGDEERVSPGVGQRIDYFHEEIIRTLADGDPTLLQAT